MKTYKQFVEGLLDDLVGEFDFEEPKDKPKLKIIKGRSEKKRRINIKGSKPTQSTYVDRSYVRGYTLDRIIKLFAEKNIMVKYNVTLPIPTKDLNKYREYDRKIVDGFTGKQTEEEYNDLKASIKKSGIKNYMVLNLVRKQNGDVDAYLGEGNHRLRIAMELGIKSVPIRIAYVT